MSRILKIFCDFEIWVYIKENECQRSLPFATKQNVLKKIFSSFHVITLISKVMK